MNSLALIRSLVVFAIIVPLALVIGYLMANPDNFQTIAVMGLVLGVLVFPILLRWHHVFLIVSWHAYVNVFFLPGQPQLWLLLAVVSLGISILKRTLSPRFQFISVPALSWPLIFLAAVILGTAFATGGVGVRALGGGAYGGKGYFYIIGAIIGYFALSAQRVAPERAYLLVSLYFAGAVTAIASNLAYAGGPSMYFLYLLFPVDFAVHQAVAEQSVNPLVIQRISGLAPAASGLLWFMLLRFGLNGTFDFRHPWRLLLFIVSFGASLFGGFRSAVLISGILIVVLFFLEGLHKTKALPAVLLGLLLAGAALIPLAPKLPLAVQRSISFLPLPIDDFARQNADASSEWRFQMWKILVPQIPDYLWLGKGYSIDPTALYLAEQGVRLGLFPDYEVSLLAGDYHSGPLSVIIPFGVFGVVGFLWFLIAGFWVLYRNYRYGDKRLLGINRFLLAFFIMRSASFLLLFGAFNSELFLFTGIVGLSVALNGGARKKAIPSLSAPVQADLQPA